MSSALRHAAGEPSVRDSSASAARSHSTKRNSWSLVSCGEIDLLVLRRPTLVQIYGLGFCLFAAV